MCQNIPERLGSKHKQQKISHHPLGQASLYVGAMQRKSGASAFKRGVCFGLIPGVLFLVTAPHVSNIRLWCRREVFPLLKLRFFVHPPARFCHMCASFFSRSPRHPQSLFALGLQQKKRASASQQSSPP
jgi:hypothetical protein